MSGAIQYPESAVAWRLRTHWAKRDEVVLKLSERAAGLRVRGYVEYVSPTASVCAIDDGREPPLSVPIAHVLTVLTPHFTAGDSPARRRPLFPEDRPRLDADRQIPGQLSFEDAAEARAA